MQFGCLGSKAFSRSNMEQGSRGKERKREKGRQSEEEGGHPKMAKSAGDSPSTFSASSEEVSSRGGHHTAATEISQHQSICPDPAVPSTSQTSMDFDPHEDREVPEVSVHIPPCLATTAPPTSAVPSPSHTAPVARGPGDTSAAEAQTPGRVTTEGQLDTETGTAVSAPRCQQFNQEGARDNILAHTDNVRLQSIAAWTSANLEKACPHGFVRTSQYYTALAEVKKHGSCIVTGTSGSGKTTLARHLLLAFKDKGFSPLELITPEQCERVPLHEVGKKRRLVLLVDNVVGEGNFEDELRRKWEIQLNIMKPYIERGHVLVILTSRANIYAAIRGVKGSGQVLYEAPEVSLTGRDCQLSRQEREEILRNTLAFHKAKLPDQVSIDSIISASESAMKIGFPQLCVYLATNQTALRDPVTFFKNPLQFLTEEFYNLKSDDLLSYFVLILVLLQEGELSESFVKDEKNEKFLTGVAKMVGFSEAPGFGKIRDMAKQLCESYLECNSQSQCFSFTHQSVWDVLFSELCKSEFSIHTDQ